MSRVLMLGTHIDTMGGISSVVRNYFEHGMMDHLGIKYVATHRDGKKYEKIMFLLKQLPVILVNLLRSKIVHLHASQGWSYRRLFMFLVIARLFRKKVILHIHGSRFDKYFHDAGPIEKYIIYYGLEKADIVIALSEEWRKILCDINPRGNYQVIRNAVNISDYKVAARDLHHPLRVLFLGRLGERKGIYDILNAIRIIGTDSCEFTLAGDGEVEKIKEIVKREGWDKFVNVPGWVSKEQVSLLLENSDMYILPSYHEGLPMGILEALASGLPVISTYVGGIPEAVRDSINGYLIKPGDYRALAKYIKNIGEDSSLWKRLSHAAMRIAEDEFGMDKVEKQMKGIYEELAGRL